MPIGYGAVRWPRRRRYAILIGMTDAAGAPREDIQRPLDESEPVHVVEPGPLRSAVPRATATATPAGAGVPARPAAWWGAVARRVGRGLRRRPARGARTVAAWSRGPAGRLAWPALTVLGLVGAAATAGAFVLPHAAPPTAGGPDADPRPTASPAGAAPTQAPPVSPTGAPAEAGADNGLPADVLRGWAQQMSVRTDIPVVALQAYGYAELVVTRTTPGCQLSWTTLAAIGRVESNHGRTGDAALGPDGRALPEIIGPALDGRGDRLLIQDTDAGRIDGDGVYDRAVGPMQFIPQTWLAERIDATGDGVADPHNIHDAALAAANYLCRNGRDLATPEGWWQAVLAYNDVQRYAEEVHAAANEYGRRSHG
jgi:hypothetical protein